MLFGACSSDKDVADSKNVLEDAGVGYFKVNINLPTAPVTTTRAWTESAQLDDGSAAEYAVDDVTLILFGGTDEATAKVVQVNTLANSWSAVDGTPTQVTTKHEEVVSLSSTAAAYSNLYALAVINAAGIIDAAGSTGIKINGTAKADATLADLQAEVTAITAYDQNKFINTNKHIFMTNAVLSNVKGGTSDPGSSPALHVLAPVNKSYIYESQAAASEGTAATDIYVERGLAKVTLNLNLNSSSAITVDASVKKPNGDPVTATFEGWCLDLINSRSYIVRKVPAVATNTFAWNYTNKNSSAEKYRFVGTNTVDVEYGTSAAGYRTYWALDPNYDADAGAALLTPTDAEATITANKTKIGIDYPQYCYENTFDVDRQSYNNTTSAIIKVTFSVGDFYTIGADRKTLYSPDDIETTIANVLMAQGDFVTWLTDNCKEPASITKEDITITWSTDNAGSVSVQNITISDTKTTSGDAINLSVTEKGTTLLATVNAQVADIKRYKGGAAYYGIRIKHFGDDLTPWDSGELDTKPAESTIDKIYPGTGDARNAAYLGRYGVVRNNWYDLTVTGISKIGAATPGDVKIPDHPDDELEDSYLKARINILSWAKRTQDWNLK